MIARKATCLVSNLELTKAHAARAVLLVLLLVLIERLYDDALRCRHMFLQHLGVDAEVLGLTPPPGDPKSYGNNGLLWPQPPSDTIQPQDERSTTERDDEQPHSKPKEPRCDQWVDIVPIRDGPEVGGGHELPRNRPTATSPIASLWRREELNEHRRCCSQTVANVARIISRSAAQVAHLRQWIPGLGAGEVGDPHSVADGDQRVQPHVQQEDMVSRPIRRRNPPTAVGVWSIGKLFDSRPQCDLPR
mmetsp:Transcript_13520/g.29589  ORF Transcript_13520/g.29589 Transcript_13520/m.29589 type:complete len:247 (-) Transcript_13520:1250-1990(-)